MNTLRMGSKFMNDCDSVGPSTPGSSSEVDPLHCIKGSSMMEWAEVHSQKSPLIAKPSLILLIYCPIKYSILRL